MSARSSGGVLAACWNRSASAYFQRGDERAMGLAVSSPFTERTRGSGTLVFDFIARLTVIALTIVITPGVTVTNSVSLVLAVVGIAVAGWLLRPVFVRIAFVANFRLTPNSAARRVRYSPEAVSANDNR